MAICVQNHMIDCQVTSGPPRLLHRLSQKGQRLLRLWRSKVRERRNFTSLDSRDLHDLGLSHWDVEREIARRFWRD
jgi:uncharacterized protein YjiS (DUF1127 family)